MIRTSATPAKADEFPALIAALCSAARMPVAVARLSDAAGTPYALGSLSQCHPAPLIDVGEDILEKDATAALGATAHEIAHHALGHVASLGRNTAEKVAWFALFAGWAASIFGYRVFSLPALFLIGAAGAWRGRTGRKREYAADEAGVQLLNAAGLDGTGTMGATLEWLAAEEPRIHRMGGWVLSGHPLTSRRIARLEG